MPIEAWFPLALYYADLPQGPAQNPSLLRSILDLRGDAVARRTPDHAAWTGDVHSVERLHLDPAFAWITAEVGRHSYAYLEALGLDLARIDLYIQRAWPVVSARGQYISRHAHHTAHVSAVYYVSAPGGERAGRIRFFNEGRYNELSGGLASSMTGAYASFNPFNHQMACYQPVEGRLLIFPAKQAHDVEANESEEDRVSISYDIVMTSREDGMAGLHEFLMPPPMQWAPCRRVEEL